MQVFGSLIRKLIGPRTTLPFNVMVLNCALKETIKVLFREVVGAPEDSVIFSNKVKPKAGALANLFSNVTNKSPSSYIYFSQA